MTLAAARWFGAEDRPPGHRGGAGAAAQVNWVPTIPGKGPNVLFRLDGPLGPWFNKARRPGEIELVE